MATNRRDWWAVAVPFAAAAFGGVASGIALSVSHYTDTVLFVFGSGLMAGVGVRNARALRHP